MYSLRRVCQFLAKSASLKMYMTDSSTEYRLIATLNEASVVALGMDFCVNGPCSLQVGTCGRENAHLKNARNRQLRTLACFQYL